MKKDNRQRPTLGKRRVLSFGLSVLFATTALVAITAMTWSILSQRDHTLQQAGRDGLNLAWTLGERVERHSEQPTRSVGIKSDLFGGDPESHPRDAPFCFGSIHFRWPVGYDALQNCATLAGICSSSEAASDTETTHVAPRFLSSRQRTHPELQSLSGSRAQEISGLSRCA
jgi:hypothetical protein